MSQTINEEIDDIRDLADSAESVEELRHLVKSATKLAKRRIGNSPDGDAGGSGKTIQSDDDDENYDDDGDDDAPRYANDGANEDSDHDGDSDTPAPAPVGRRMNKSLSDAMRDAPLPQHGDGLDAMPVIAAVSDSLLENNQQGFQNFEMLSEIQSTLARMNKSLSGRLTDLEDELARQHPMIKSAAAFVDGIRRTPAGTPSSVSGAPVGGALFGKSLPGAAPEDFQVEGETLRGLTEKQLIKGLGSRLNRDDADHAGLDVTDLQKIGEVSMSKLNPKIAEIAAEELGIALEA